MSGTYKDEKDHHQQRIRNDHNKIRRRIGKTIKRAGDRIEPQPLPQEKVDFSQREKEREQNQGESPPL